MTVLRNTLSHRGGRHPRQSAWWLTGCFFLPAIVMLAVYASFGMAPFGERSVLIMDLSEQYVDFFAGLKDVWNGNASLQFSWSKAFGQNYIGVIAYHLSSPLSLLTLLVPNEHLPAGLLLLNVLKIGLAGLTFGIFLKGFFRRCDSSSVIFSTAYGLISYSVVYSMNLMWLDGVIWLPIVLLGVEQLVQAKRMRLFLISLAVVFVSTFYISYMIGIFAFLFFLLRFFAVWEKPSLRMFGGRFARFLGAAVAAAGLGAWLLLPTLQALYQGKIGDAGFNPQQLTNFPFFQQFSKYIIGSYSTIIYFGLPNVFCGVLAGVLFVLFFCCRKIPWKEKMGSGAVVLLFVLSFYLVPLEKAWSGFQYPNWFPARYSFLFSFFMLFLAYRAFLQIREFSPAVLLGAGGFCLVAVAAIALWANGAKVETFLVLLTAAAVVLYTALLFVARTRRGWVALPVLLVLVAAELGFNAQQLVNGLNRQFGYKTNASYVDYQKELLPLLQEAQGRTEDFYRLEKTFERGKNDAIGLGYRGLTHYSSTYNREINSLTKRLGIAQQYFWSEYRGSTALTDAVFNIRYLLAREGEPVFYPQISGDGDIGLYENPYCLSLGFMADSRIVSQPLPESGDPFQQQNALMQNLTGNEETCFVPVAYEQASEGVQAEQHGGVTRFLPLGGKATVTYTIQAPAGKPVYLYLPVDGKGSCRLIVDGNYRGDLYGDLQQCILPVGAFEQDTEVTVKLELRNSEVNLKGQYFYALDLSTFKGETDALKEAEWDTKDYTAVSVQGTVPATSEKQILFTSIPYDSGWTVWVDGEEREPLTLCGTFLGVLLEPGEHYVSMRYAAPGFEAGCWISLFTAAALILICAFLYVRKKRGFPRLKGRER